MWDVNQTLYVAVGHRGSFSQLFLNILRASIKAVIVLLLGELRPLVITRR